MKDEYVGTIIYFLYIYMYIYLYVYIRLYYCWYGKNQMPCLLTAVSLYFIFEAHWNIYIALIFSKRAVKLPSDSNRDTKTYVKTFKAIIVLCFKAKPLLSCLQTAISMPTDSCIRASLHHDQTTTDNNSHQPLGHRQHAAHWSFHAPVFLARAVAHQHSCRHKKPWWH